MATSEKNKVVIPILVVAQLFSSYHPAHCKFAGPYYLTVVSGGLCSKEEVGITGDDIVLPLRFHHRRGCKDSLVTGNMTLKNGIGMPGNTSLLFLFAKWDSVSGWRENYFQVNLGELCYIMATYVVAFKDLIRKHSPAIPYKCPIRDDALPSDYSLSGSSHHGFVFALVGPAGPPQNTYPFNEVPTRFDTHPGFPALPYGRFRVRQMAYNLRTRSKTPRGCLRWVLDISEKVTRP
ncbi:uncharacterized protein LOC117648250 isoform X1 [Thrips palmi]|uniref:Uncharacterized protein LOC117648250 isoform X1 n=1 Tax=Thrips palmi TaxID=161013 RepID=A0A6P8Z217_THRPL|nr:uncharacterized protein LOC117648250 isoform X1 [Thrips palmi]